MRSLNERSSKEPSDIDLVECWMLSRTAGGPAPQTQCCQFPLRHGQPVEQRVDEQGTNSVWMNSVLTISVGSNSESMNSIQTNNVETACGPLAPECVRECVPIRSVASQLLSRSVSSGMIHLLLLGHCFTAHLLADQMPFRRPPK